MILIGNIKSVVYRAILSLVSGISLMLQKLPQYRNGHVEVDEWWFGSAVTCLTRKPFISRGCGADPQHGARSPPFLSPSFTCYYINIVYLVQGHWSTKFIFWYHYILYLLFQYFNLSTIKLICGQLELLICTLLLIYN